MRADLAAAEAADHIALHEQQNLGAVSASGVRQYAGASAPVCTTLTIPVPPSVNKLFANRAGGRFKTREYKDWLSEAAWMIREQLPDPVPGRIVVLISAERESLSADIDNRVKAILDLLVKSKVIDDDRFVTGVAVSWAPRGRGRTARARIAIMPAVAHRLEFHPSEDGATGGWFLNAPEDDGEV